jgi:hypothetical protein
MKISKLKEILTLEKPYILILGTVSSGKSHIIREIYKYYNYDNKYLASVVISSTEKTEGFYKTFVDKKFVYNEYNINVINNVLKRQTLLINNNNNINYINININTILILENCLSSNGKWIHNDEIKELFYNKSNYLLTSVITFRLALNIPIQIRDSFDYIFILNELLISTHKKIYENYAYKVFDTFEEFRKIYLHIMYDKFFNCMVLDIKNKKYFVYNSHY